MTTLIRSASLTNFVEVARSVGLDPYRQLRQAGIAASALLDPESMIPVRSLIRLLQECAELSGVQDFGLRMAESRQLINLGPLAFVVRGEPTLRKALETTARYQRLQNEALQLGLEEEGEVAILTQELLGAARLPLRQSHELLVCVLYRMLKLLLGPQWQAHSIAFSHAPPTGGVATHRRVFGVAVRFNQDVNGIVFARADLDVTLPSHDPVMALHARDFLDAKLAQAEPKVPDKVQKVVATLLPKGECTADRVAQQLGVDRKTLYRHLARHEQTYSGIVDAVRVELVARYLGSRERQLSQVALLLGFSSLSAFSRWFTGRFGRSVSAWRRAHEAGAQGKTR